MFTLIVYMFCLPVHLTLRILILVNKYTIYSWSRKLHSAKLSEFVLIRFYCLLLPFKSIYLFKAKLVKKVAGRQASKNKTYASITWLHTRGRSKTLIDSSERQSVWKSASLTTWPNIMKTAILLNKRTGFRAQPWGCGEGNTILI